MEYNYATSQPPPYYQPTTQVKFKNTDQKYRDVGFLLAFIVHLACLVALLFVGVYREWIAEDTVSGDQPIIEIDRDSGKIFGVLAAASGVGLVLAIAWIYIAGAFTKQIIYISVVTTVALFIALAMISFVIGNFTVSNVGSN
jgi:hypothetical protein